MNANIKILLQSENLLDVLQGVVDVLLLNAEDLSALLQAANRGISTKNLPEAENRGYGITTSRNMLVKGLGGTFLMMSGDAVYMNSPKIQHFVQMPQGFGVKGTLVAMRIPFKNEVFNYINFVE